MVFSVSAVVVTGRAVGDDGLVEELIGAQNAESAQRNELARTQEGEAGSAATNVFAAIYKAVTHIDRVSMRNANLLRCRYELELRLPQGAVNEPSRSQVEKVSEFG